MQFEVPLEGSDEGETLPTNVTDVASFGVDEAHVPGKGVPVDEGLLTVVAFVRFLPHVDGSDVSEKK